MKKILAIISIQLGIILFVTAQSPKLFSEKKTGGHVIYASNAELYPVSISLELEIINLAFSEGDKKIFVIPAKSDKYKIGELTIIEKAGTNFHFKYRSAMGDVTLTNYDRAFEYDLPFQKGKSYKLFQGYNGRHSHQGENSLDFTMPEGSEILASRAGMVVQVVQNNTESCPRPECKQYNNNITIMHADGTFARYVHIKYNGARYSTGDLVKKGDIIALSGNTGYTAGPHLHFVCFTPGFDKWNAIETKFKIDKGEKAVLLQEGLVYSRDY